MRTVWLFGFLLAAVERPLVASGEDADGAGQAIPVIRLEKVPLLSAIRNLARQGELNCIVDPWVTARYVGADGHTPQEPYVNVVWTNITAADGLGRLLDKHDLKLVSNSVTTVTRIVSAKRPAREPAAELAPGTNAVIPLITMEDLRLADAITALANESQMKVAFDRGLRVASINPNGIPISECYVAVRWKGLTGQQALTALLENYDLVLLPPSDGGAATVTSRGQAPHGAAGAATEPAATR